MFGYGEQDPLEGTLPWLLFRLIQDYEYFCMAYRRGMDNFMK
jgi:hypothetical protein